MAAKKSVLKRETIGRSSSSKKMLGDALTVAGAAGATGLWTATRTGPSKIFWGLGFVGLGALTMLESQPGTFLESGGAGILGANTGILLLDILGMLK